MQENNRLHFIIRTMKQNKTIGVVTNIFSVIDVFDVNTDYINKFRDTIG